MYWLITYSQKCARGNTLPANCPIQDMHPADWLLEMVKEYPQENTLLLFAIEISKEQFNAINGEI